MNPEQRSWWRRPSRSAPAVILTLVVIGLVGFRMASRSGLNREMEEIRAKGLPTNPKELDEWYAAVPAMENAGLKLLEARDVFVEAERAGDPGEVDWREIPHGEALDAETIGILEAHLGKNAETLRLMREAAKMERSRYPTDLSKAPDIKFDHLIPLKTLAQLARWEAVLKAERGDAAGAVEALKNGFAVAHTLAQEPLLISELVRMACMAIQVFGMERVVNVARFDEAQLGELAAKVREASEESRLALHRALVGERAFANTGRKLTFGEYEQLVTWGGLSPNTSEVPEVLRAVFYYSRRAVGMQDRDHAFYMRSLGRMIEAAALDHPELFARSEALVGEIEVELSEHPIAYELSKFSLGSMFRVPNREVILIARLRCVEMALEIERWRRKNGGGLPREHELTSIFRVYPSDPVDGAPLKFQPKGDGGYRVIAEAATAEEKKGGANPKSPGIGFSIER